MIPFRQSIPLLTCLFVFLGCAPGARSDDKKWTMPAPKPLAPPPPAKNEPLKPELQAAAKAALYAALADADEYVRMHAIEAMQQTLGVAAKDVYLKGLSDESAKIRFAAAMAVGQLHVAAAKDRLLQMVNDPDGNVMIAVRYALHRLGDTRFTKDLQNTARDPLVWQYRAQTAMVLGLLNEPTAVRVLKPMQRDAQAAVRIQVAEALWRLGEMDGLRTLVASSTSGYPDDQLVAVLGLAARKDTRVTGHVRSALTADYPEVCLVAARAMGILGDDDGYAIAIEGAKSPDARQRSLAALALGAIGRSDAQGVLAGLLEDKDSADVRLSAATAILQLKTPANAKAE
jgi:HEAT repeat protein